MTLRLKNKKEVSMKIMTALSGGVDSTITAYLLQKAGHEVLGCYMKLHERKGYHEENIAKVAKVSDFLGIKYEVLDLTQDFEREVFLPFVNAYQQGITPNPCAICNKEIKLGKLLAFAQKNGCEKLATGHYARLEGGLLKAAFDESKDQTYFLANSSPEALAHVIFPLGDMLKADVKKIAAQIPVLSSFATQKESSEICFVPETYTKILDEHVNTRMPGIVRDLKGRAVGSHEGYMNYTIGKRRGFSVHGAHEPHFVLKIDAKNNEITVGKREDLSIQSFSTVNLNAFLRPFPKECFVKIRYKSPMTPCFVENIHGSLPHDALASSSSHGAFADCGALVKLEEPVFGLASGQLAVFYQQNDKGENLVIGSGFIA